jgi:hypothetical protein
MIKLLKIFTLAMERKYFIQNITPLLNTNVEILLGFSQRMGILKENSPMHPL